MIQDFMNKKYSEKTVMTTNNDKAAILDFWHAIELFSPQAIPRLAPRDSVEPVFSIEEGLPLPWDPNHFLQGRYKSLQMRSRYQVFCGIFKLEKIHKILEEKLSKPAENYEERTSGESCLFTFSVTQEGRPLFDTFTISSCAWATGRTLDPGPHDLDWLKDFNLQAHRFSTEFEERLTILQNDDLGKELLADGLKVGRPIKYSDLLEETQRMAKVLGLSSLFGETFEIRIKNTQISAKKEYATDSQDFLNSFFLNDLKKISHEVQQGNIGKGLDLFLSDLKEVDDSKRLDIKDSTDPLSKELSPNFFPSGKWPSKGNHPLVYSQQLAVNYAINNLRDDLGLISINGPPGTGKTTLLRDLIAAIIVERATRLSQYTYPAEAFVGNKKWQSGEFTRSVSLWNEALKGFEIVVASSNNTAVENVTLEIPSIGAIDPTWLSESDYFPELASELIGHRAWGMLAARLGNKSNRQQFLNQFWYADTSKKGKKNNPSTTNGLLLLLKEYENEAVDWEEAVNQFKGALKEEEKIRDQRIEIHKCYHELEPLKYEISLLEKQLQELFCHQTQYENNLLISQKKQSEILNQISNLKNERIENRNLFPHLLDIIFSWGKSLKKWRKIDLDLNNKMAQAKCHLRKVEQNILQEEKELFNLVQKIQKTQNQIDESKNKKDLIEKKIRHGIQLLGEHFPFYDKAAKDEDDRELSSPWSDPVWNKARSKIFIEALTLHKAFIIANAGILRKNLHACMDILSGSVPETASIDAIEAAWTTLFFFVPVISTTFASFDRVFGHLGRERLGWLLIDEAGQAVPQAAVGAIWRTKRTVVVGDRLQLEPVVTCPLSIQETLRSHYNIDDIWVPSFASVQKLSDRISVRGTYITTAEDEEMWVGTPLRVHRRCDRTIFNISNQIAYGGLMVFGTPQRIDLNFPPSAWIDVKNAEADGHWIPDEGSATLELIDSLVRNGAKLQDIFLISPFRSVVKQLKQITRPQGGIKAGTIHTVQGKETDIVILVLGGDPKNHGAKKWASARPNLLNVAASRAKRRFYVIGNRELWGKYQYFKTLKSLLPENNTCQKIAI